MRLAPIALFVYRRPDHTRRTLESLLRNPEARESPLYVFCDGPRSAKDAAGVAETREIVRSLAHPLLEVVARDANLGLARSVIAGVSTVTSAHGSAIVLEDDLVLAPTFLAFMNAALERYRDAPEVFAVSGYTYPADLEDRPADAVFLPLIASWGWATWERAWRRFVPGEESYARLRRDRALRRRFDVGGYPFYAMLEQQQRGEVDSWAIRWYASVFLNGGMTLFPTRSLVTNVGLDGTGVHCGTSRSPVSAGTATAFAVDRFPPVRVDEVALERIARTLGTERPTALGRAAAALRRAVRVLAPR
jgi:GT2 family glycosyltransferase